MKVLILPLAIALFIEPSLAQSDTITAEHLSDTTQSMASEIEKNVVMSELYKQVHPLSTFSPLGELGSRKAYLFTASVNPLFVISNSLFSKWNFAIGMGVPIRMFQESSFPVRTPSFIPSLRVYYNLNNEERRYKFVWAAFTHHSNGQDGEAFVDNEWNTKNGNFSTNWTTLQVEWGDNFGSTRKHWSLGLLQHVSLGNVLGQEEALRGYYGQTRINFNFQARLINRINLVSDAKTVKSYLKEMRRWHFNVQLVAAGNHKSDDRLTRSINFELYRHWFFKKMKDGGLFISGGYYGEDPYNIFFYRRYPFIRFGLSAGSLVFKL